MVVPTVLRGPRRVILRNEVTKDLDNAGRSFAARRMTNPALLQTPRVRYLLEQFVHLIRPSFVATPSPSRNMVVARRFAPSTPCFGRSSPRFICHWQRSDRCPQGEGFCRRERIVGGDDPGAPPQQRNGRPMVVPTVLRGSRRVILRNEVTKDLNDVGRSFAARRMTIPAL